MLTRVLALFLMLWAPLQFAMRASAGLSALDVRGWPLGLFLVAYLIVTAIGFAAGRTLLDRGASSTRLAIVAFALMAVIDTLYYGTSIFPSSLPPGDAPVYLGLALALDAAAITILVRSTSIDR